jgi:hypothetical protein
MRPTPDRELAVDAATIALGSVAISLASQELVLMTALMPALVLARFAAWRLVARGGPLAVEAAFFAACTALGAFNDWNSVVNHRIYDYTVPVFFPTVTTIPLWMLLFWGMILRFLLALALWERLGPPPVPEDAVRLGRRVRVSPALKVALQLALVLITRQAIYRTYLDPVWSWLPFLAAAGAYAWLFGFPPHARRLAALMLIGGPLIEILYIQVGHLHAYHLGWLGGVPLWIALWWVVAVMVWTDLGRRLHALILTQTPPSCCRSRSRDPPGAT